MLSHVKRPAFKELRFTGSLPAGQAKRNLSFTSRQCVDAAAKVK